MRHNKLLIKTVSLTLLLTMVSQLVMPTVVLALTTGPSQPEVQSFEPVGTTDMVDMFSGGFVYNIPLMDVEGYPVNISYHGNVTMEQEASWVGLGWNINPGTINRTVRGTPDDFNGDTISRQINIKPEKTIRVGAGVGVEFAGVGDPVLDLNVNLDLGANVNISNYRGVSCDFSLGGGINVFHSVSAGVNLGVGSQSGASVDYNAGLTMASSQILGSDIAGGIGVNVGGGYSTRSGIKDLNLSYSVGKHISQTIRIPIGTQNYVPVITNSSTMNTIYGRIKGGGELFSVYAYGNISAMVSMLKYASRGDRQAYGYLYLQNATNDNTSILDFTRDKDGMFNKSMQYLPVPAMTYDVYSLTGQGTGGSFRPFRNDFGSVYDPVTVGSASSNGGEVELGLGDLLESGIDKPVSATKISSGPWSAYHRSGLNGFTSSHPGSIYENTYFKQAGELTSVDPAYYTAIGGTAAITPDAAMKLPATKPNSTTNRDPRGNLVYYYTAQEDTMYGVGTSPNIVSYTNSTFTDYGNPQTNNISRIGYGPYQRKKHQVSEIQQLQKDGKRYIYGIPAMNNVQREATFAVEPDNGNTLSTAGAVHFGGDDATANNRKGRDNYYNSAVTPSYAHSYLLTSVLSADYVDVTGNGVSDDDLGSFTKFNYTRIDSDYRWVSPYSANLDSAQYNSGFWSDKLDDKGSFVCGSREQWNLHSIETKNFIAEFYTSPRNDAKGITAPILNNGGGSIYTSTKGTSSVSYKLDSVKLYNKHDRYINGANAVPIKTVFFVYDYSLCPGIPNGGGGGKLTLSKIYFRYGNSSKSMTSPYQFAYDNNYPYNLACKDRWGDYKVNNSAFPNWEYPYANQNDPSAQSYASAWALKTITLPSGGTIQVSYARNDYAFVQDKAANEMFMINGLGNSTAYNTGNLLFKDRTPYLYAYFTRRKSSENSKLTFAQNYAGINFKKDDKNCQYFNFAVRLTGANNTYEAIKGYGNISDIGPCVNDTTHGYIRFTPVIPTGGGASMNPATYTALNVGRYNLPQILYPGQDPDASDLKNILAGLKDGFDNLIKIGQNPFIAMMDKGDAQNVDLSRSYIRLQSVGLRKMGGGSRVQQLAFYDNWSTLAGGNESSATYGKIYDYTIDDPTYGTISSGVASYEPLIGGDENPLRQPVPYIGVSGSNWPPNDPVNLYQEMPIGESLFPAGQVGYSQVRVYSLNKSVAPSAQGVDLYQFYTAKDFPAKVITSAINEQSKNHIDFFSQQNLLTATQGYSLVFNDMHGKPKRVEHDLYNPVSKTYQPITYQAFFYHEKNGQLDNNVNCIVNSGGSMVVQSMQLGVEEDVTLDTRMKDEDTHNNTDNFSLNIFIAWLFPVAIPLGFSWPSEYENSFHSAVVGKVVQQYGILDSVVSFNEDALTTVRNELYDPVTGTPVVTSVNNEYKDKEYTTNIPAYWAYKGMSPAYNNIGYKDVGTITIDTNYVGRLHISNSAPLDEGDQVSVFYTDTSGKQQNIVAWITGNLRSSGQNKITHHNIHTVCDTTYSLPLIPRTTTSYCITKPLTITVTGGDSTFAPYNSCSPTVQETKSVRLVSTTVTIPGSGTLCNPSGTISTNMSGSYTVLQYHTCVGSSTSYTYSATTAISSTKSCSISSSGTSGNISGMFTDANSIGAPTNFAFNGHFTLQSKLDTVGYDSTRHITCHDVDSLSYTYDPYSYCGTMSITPRFPTSTPGWHPTNTLTNVVIKVIRSGRTNMLDQYAETYVGMNNPTSGQGILAAQLSNLINLNAKTFSDSNTRIPYYYLFKGDTINPYAIGERGLWRVQNEYSYIKSRKYTGTTARNAGIFNGTNFYAPLVVNTSLCSMYPQLYLQLAGLDPNWHLQRSVTKYSPNGKEVENIDAIGNYSTAVYGYNEELPIAVASNAQQGEILADGFEDYAQLLPKNNLVKTSYSPFRNFFSTTSLPSSQLYNIMQLNSSNGFKIASNEAHTGMYSMYIPGPPGLPPYPVWVFGIPMNNGSYAAAYSPYNTYFPYDPYDATVNHHMSSANQYLPFTVTPLKKYVLSFWMKPKNPTPNISSYSIPAGVGIFDDIGNIIAQAYCKSGIIDGWQQVEAVFTTTATSIELGLPFETYIDDIRIYPDNSNMKSFVYNPVNEKLMAILDENNFATIYEYDPEGNLVRVKKETSQGIITVSETRSGNPKQ